MGKINSYKELEVWQKSIAIAVRIFRLIRSTPKLKKDFGFSDQIRRSAISISSNIAEGFERNNNNELIRFLKIAKGSNGELNSQIILLHKVEYIDEKKFKNLNSDIENLAMQISKFISYLQKKRNEGEFKNK